MTYTSDLRELLVKLIKPLYLSSWLLVISLTPAVADLNSPQGKSVMIPAGTTFEGRIDTAIGSHISHPGQRFNLNMATPVLANGIDVVIPAGTQVMGEVVEAISSESQPHEKKQPKKNGKLRVQISGLRTPDGTTYPLIASFVAETFGQAGSGGNGQTAVANPNLGGGVGYVGTQANFNTIYPHGRKFISKQEILGNPLYGDPEKFLASSHSTGVPNIRALEKRHRDLLIPKGSAMSIRLDAPFRIAITPTAGAQPAIKPAELGADGFNRRFSRPDADTSPPQAAVSTSDSIAAPTSAPAAPQPIVPAATAPSPIVLPPKTFLENILPPNTIPQSQINTSPLAVPNGPANQDCRAGQTESGSPANSAPAREPGSLPPGSSF